MSCPWICLSLLYAATFLRSSASSNNGVSLKCTNTTVEVVAGENVTLNCSIYYSGMTDCKCLSYMCLNTHVLCKSDCESDNQTYVSPTILNVTKEDNYTVLIKTDCGHAESAIKVQLKNVTLSPRNSEQPTKPDGTPFVRAILGIFFILIVLGI